MSVVAYLGPENTNTHFAALAKFGRRSTYLHAPTVDEVFHLVERQQAEYGVVPIENSLVGSVTGTLDRFVDFVHSPVRIQGEIEQPIRHYLILHKDAGLVGLKVVYSHPQALAQCGRWLDKHAPYAQRSETNSTAEAVKELVNPFTRKTYVGNSPDRIEKVMEGPKPAERAAIARPELAAGKGLRSIAIPNERENTTRFLILGLGEPRRGRHNKTSLLFALKDRPGALHDALMPFKRYGINLTKIESRPSRRKAWEYLFFIDVEGHASEPRVRKALTGLARSTSLIRILGSYPACPPRVQLGRRAASS
ncbi:MAG: prephenate dehydratase [Candidatus Omnitrophica bacterium]|nr:prephenate dehydratase [Candidatus Omnitrophota bacterium]